MSTLRERFLEQWPVATWRSHRVVVAISGGPDSTALARLLSEGHPEPQRLYFAHYHHGLRGADADADAEFVSDLARRCGAHFVTARAAAGEIQRRAGGEGLESAARQLRYAFLVEAAKQHGARFVVTGHTADDQVETVLSQLLRGSGLAGLAGIPRCRVVSEAVTILRPLLEFNRAELLEYLATLKQASRHDPHNDQRRFRRNRIRHELLPWLEQHLQPSVRQAVRSIAQIAEDTQEFVRAETEKLADRCLLQIDDEVHIDAPAARNAHVHLRRELFVWIWQRQSWPRQAMSYQHWQRLATCLEAAPGTAEEFDLPGGIRARVVANRLSLRSTAGPGRFNPETESG